MLVGEGKKALIMYIQYSSYRMLMRVQLAQSNLMCFKIVLVFPCLKAILISPSFVHRSSTIYGSKVMGERLCFLTRLAPHRLDPLNVAVWLNPALLFHSEWCYNIQMCLTCGRQPCFQLVLYSKVIINNHNRVHKKWTLTKLLSTKWYWSLN